MTSLCLNGVILSRKAELDQFQLGLSPLVDIIKKINSHGAAFVVGRSQPPTAEDLCSLVQFDEFVEDRLKTILLNIFHWKVSMNIAYEYCFSPWNGSIGVSSSVVLHA